MFYQLTQVDKSQPQRVDALLGTNLRSVACGQYHSMVVTDTGKLLACGKNDYGQLGLYTDDGQVMHKKK